MIQFTAPWRQPPLKDWKLLAMYHTADGQLSVRMSKDGREIKETGLDNRDIWSRLYSKAVEFDLNEI